MAYLSCSIDVLFLYLGQSPLSMSIIFNIKKAKSLLQPSLSSVNGKWQLLQVNSCPCICDQSSLSGLTRREVAEDEHCCLTARRDAACVYSHCAELRGAVRRS